MLRWMILAGLAVIGLTAPAAALPLSRPDAPGAPIVQVYGGCGPYGHRGPLGGCRPGGQWGGYGRPVFRTYAYYGRPGWYGPRWGGYRRFGWRRWGWHHHAGWHHGWGWHRRFGWHGGHRWGGFRRAGWHGGWHGGFHGGWRRHR